MMVQLFLLVLCSIKITGSQAQGYFKTDYYTTSSFLEKLKDSNRNKESHKIGAGNMFKMAGEYTFRLSVKQKDATQPVIWAASINGSYMILKNYDMIENIHPGQILIPVSISHIADLYQKAGHYLL